MTQNLILINPWIYDFAAYDFWSKPMGLLCLAAHLRQAPLRIHLIDCLDIHHPRMWGDPSLRPPARHMYGTGKYWRQEVNKPPPLRHIHRPYSRYGITPHLLEEELRKVRDPKAILVTSLMTYWYPGVQEVIRVARSVHPRSPIILGGIYARLCREHAQLCSGADLVVTETTPRGIGKRLAELDIPLPVTTHEPWRSPYPAFDLLRQLDYVCLLTSTGCPYRCRYCASHFLHPAFTQGEPADVVEQIRFWHRHYGVQDFAFYDDALLVASDDHLVPLLEGLAAENLAVRFHTPNAVHVKGVTAKIASLLRRVGFRTVRLGLETSDDALHRDLDGKLTRENFDRAVRHLLHAGFRGRELGAYVLVGLPGQSSDSVRKTIEYVAGTGATPYLAEYSPIPHTDMWTEALHSSPYNLAAEPLFHNNTLLPCWDDRQRDELRLLKQRALELRGRLGRPPTVI